MPGARVIAILVAVIAMAPAAAAPAIAAEAGETRETLSIGAAARDELRAGMRSYLQSVQGIVEGLSSSRAALVAESARRSGEGMLTLQSITTGAGLPAGFVMLGLDTHRKFDSLAALASSGAQRLQVLGALNDILANCTSCHAAYRIAP